MQQEEICAVRGCSGSLASEPRAALGCCHDAEKGLPFSFFLL